MTRWARAARLAASLAAMGLVFMGAIVMPVYLVPALTAVLALGLAAESHPGWGPAIRSRLDVRGKMPQRATRRSSPLPAGSPAAGVTE